MKISDINRLTWMLSNKIMVIDDACNGRDMKTIINDRIRQFVDEKLKEQHESIFTVTSHGRSIYRAHVRDDNGKRIATKEGAKLDNLYKALFDCYTGLSLKTPTLSDGFEWLLVHRKTVQGIADKTVSRIRQRFANFTDAELCGTDITEITDVMLCECIRKRCGEYTKAHGKRPKVTEIRLFLQVISAIYTQIIPSHGILAANPASGVKAEYFRDCADTSVRTAETKCMEPGDAEKLVRCCENSTCASAFGVRLVYCTGMRAGEICALKWSDIEGEWIHIHSQQVRTEKDGHSAGMQIVPWTKNERNQSAGGRLVPVTPELKKVLSDIKAEQVRRGTCRADGYVLSMDPEHPERPLMRDAYTEYFRRTAVRLGISTTHSHALRMFVNSYKFIPAGLTTPQRAALLGHRPETNERYYTFAGKSAREDAAEKLFSFAQREYHPSKAEGF